MSWLTLNREPLQKAGPLLFLAQQRDFREELC